MKIKIKVKFKEEKIMENASKALIIAGAILLAIVLISLGMIILGQGEDIVKNNGMNQAQITALNSKFTK